MTRLELDELIARMTLPELLELLRRITEEIELRAMEILT